MSRAWALLSVLPSVAPSMAAAPAPTLRKLAKTDVLPPVAKQIGPTSTPWWVSEKPSEAETSCLMEHRYGCYVIQHQETCLGSRDGREQEEWRGLKIRGEPCVWCGGGPCHTNSSNLCEPYDFLMHGKGVAFASFNAMANHQVARCRDGHPLPPTPLPTLPPLPTLAPWWIPQRPTEANMSCLTSYSDGCSSIRDMGTCLSSRDGSALQEQNGLKIHGEPCVWCGGGLCHSNSSSLCEPFDFLMHGEGKSFTTFFAKASFSVAGCTEGTQLPQNDFACLQSRPSGCGALTDAATCLGSRDGRPNATLFGRKVNGQPCVWCGGVPCHSANTNLCEPFDLAVNGESTAFFTFHAKLTYRLAACKNNRPAAATLDGYARFVPGYVPMLASAPLVPHWVPQRPPAANISCLQPHAAGCHMIADMGTCLSSRDGQGIAESNGFRIHGEPCVWCGGGACHSNSSSRCESFDFLMHGEGVGFSTFHAKASFTVASCPAGIPTPAYDYGCLREQPSGCNMLTDATHCLSSRDGRPNATLGGLKVRGEPCVWCGGGLCHSGGSSMCEPFDYAVNGAGRAFHVFHARSTYRIAACRDGQPAAATLQGFADSIPGFMATAAPVALPPMPTLNPRWWVPQKPSDSEMACLMDHRFGCYVIQHRETCLGSRDGRATREWRGLKIHGEPCVWCGGGPCHTNSSNLCEPYDFLMHGEGIGFSSFNAKTTHQVARCKDGEPLPPSGGPTLPPLTPPVMSNVVLTWGQCGGAGWIGATRCQNGSVCVAHHSYYSQCLPQLLATAAMAAGTKPAAPAQPTSSPAPAPALGVGAEAGVAGEHLGQDCWYQCGQRGGYCRWCGEGGACCRSGWAQDPSECGNVTSFSSWHHECVMPTQPMVVRKLEKVAPAATPGAVAAPATPPAAATARPVAVLLDKPASSIGHRVPTTAADSASARFHLSTWHWAGTGCFLCCVALLAYHVMRYRTNGRSSAGPVPSATCTDGMACEPLVAASGDRGLDAL